MSVMAEDYTCTNAHGVEVTFLTVAWQPAGERPSQIHLDGCSGEKRTMCGLDYAQYWGGDMLGAGEETRRACARCKEVAAS